MRILIVEDEQTICQQLSDALQAQGYSVDTASDGREGWYQLENFNYDLAVIDLGLPYLSGIELIRLTREAGKTHPILILTARSDWQDKVEGLEAGADDYVVKPFHMEEVFARINALFRRRSGRTTTEFSFGPISINTSTKTVSLDGDALTLTSFEYNTFEHLINNADRVVSKHELTEHLYSQDFDRDSNVIEVFIGRLRKKLDPSNCLKPIATVRGQGYRFTLSDNSPANHSKESN